MGALPNVQDTTSHYNLVTSITPGAFAGFNVQSGNIVWGAEADFQGIAMANADSTARPYSLNSTLDAKVRLGYATDQFLFYVAGGASTQDVNGHNDKATYSTYGVNLGIGVDFKATDRVIIGAEFTDRLMTGWDAYNSVAFHSSNQEIALRASYLLN